MNHFEIDERLEFDTLADSLTDESPATFMMEVLMTSDRDYTSRVYWRYFDTVLKMLSRRIYAAAHGADREHILLINDPFKEVVSILKGTNDRPISI